MSARPRALGLKRRVGAQGICCALAVLLLSACGPAGTVGVFSPQVITVYSTAAAQPWLAKLYDCASEKSAVISIVNQPQSAMIVLRLGEPGHLSTPAFQIARDSVQVVTNQAQGLPQLNVEQVRQLFSGQINDWSQIDPSKAGKVQVWVFAQNEDIQQAFAATLLGGSIVSSARLATSPTEMAEAIVKDANAIGILPGQWRMDNITSVYTTAAIPVLAITPSEPQGAVGDILACAQG